MEEQVTVSVKRPIKLYKSEDGALAGVLLQPGEYEMHRISNPIGKKSPWLVLPGKNVGVPEVLLTVHRDGVVVDCPSAVASNAIK